MTTLLDGRRWISLVAAFAMVVAVMAIGIPSADAGKPAYDRDFKVTEVHLVQMTDGSCVAKVWWEGLKGGRKINVELDVRADWFEGPEYDGDGTTTRATMQVLEVQRGLTGATKHTGYAEYAFSFSGTNYLHVQVRFWDRNGLYRDGDNTTSPTPDDYIYGNWEYGHDGVTCNG